MIPKAKLILGPPGCGKTYRLIEEIKDALAGNICRCTGYIQIFDSVKAVSGCGTEAVNVVAWKEDA